MGLPQKPCRGGISVTDKLSSPYNRRHPTLGRVTALMGEEDILFYRDTAPTGLQSFVTQTRILSVKEDLQIVKNILIYLTPSTRNLQFRTGHLCYNIALLRI
ncbi:MAG: hypothetical protein IPP46_14005 [Bacteroidetes bacterium]|nr:hypothetical protein [Bacteroidota bacterium]